MTRQKFKIKDCALIAIATGNAAQTLRELQNQLRTVENSSIYFHFWGGLLRPGFEEREYNNDFAEWVRHELRDITLAERLSTVDPSDFADIEDLRVELIDIIGERLDEIEVPYWARSDRHFQFIRSQIVVFDTHLEIEDPQDLVAVLPRLTVSSVFYHFIDARRRLERNCDDFRAWLRNGGDVYEKLCAGLAAIDPFFVTLAELRQQLGNVFADFFGGDDHDNAA